MNYKLLIAAVVLFAAGVAVGIYAKPAKVVTKTETQTVTQEVTKTVEVDKTDYYKNKVLIETVTTKPDGTVTRKRMFVDKSTIIKDDTSDTNSNKSSNTTTQTETSKTYAQDAGSVHFLVGRNLDNLSQDIFGAHIEKKLIGPFAVGAFGLTDKTLGLSLGMHF